MSSTNSKKNYGKISISKLENGKNALGININTPTQLFKSSNGKTYLPESIVLTPVLQGGATFTKWQFSLNGDNSWTDVNSNTNGVTIGSVGGVENCLTIRNTSTLFNTSTASVSFKAKILQSDIIFDVVTIAKLSDGISGSNGYNNAIIYLYKASSTPVTEIDWETPIIYYFDSNRLSLTPDGWSRSIPESDDPIYMTAATAYTNTMSCTIETNAWTTPIQYIRNGSDGSDGEDGKSIKRIDEFYLVSEKSTGVTVDNTSGWSTNIPNFSGNKKYLWNYSVTVLSDDTELPATTPKVIGTRGDDGQDGQDGEKGTSIQNVQNFYLASAQNTGITNNELSFSWSTSMPTLTQTEKYLWNFEKIFLDDESIIKTDAIIIGVHGGDGADGADGKDGKDGRSVVSITEEQYLSTSYEFLSGGSWQTTPVTWEKGKFVWTRSRIRYSDSSEETTSAICTTGFGIVDNVDIYYCLGDSNTSAPGEDDGWSTTYPGWVNGKYLWSKTVTSYSDGREDTETAPVCISGSKGSDGVSIVNVVEMYLSSASSSNITADTAGWSEDPTTQTMTPSKRYLWNYEITHFSNGTNEKTTPKIIGVYGDQGASGVGISKVEHRYLATSATIVNKETEGWTNTVQTMTRDKKYLWNYEIITYTNGSKTESDPVIIGAFGVDGNSITGVVEQYALTDSPSIEPLENQWNTSRPDYDPYKYMWTRSIINYSDRSSDYTSPICVTGPSSTTISLNCDTYVITKNSSNELYPSSIVVTGKKQTGSDLAVNCACRFRIEETTNGTSWTKKYESSANEETHTYTISSSNVMAVRCSMYKEGGFTQLIDQQHIPIVSDGINGTDGIDGEDGVAYTIFLTNESHTFAAGTEYAYETSVSTNIVAMKNTAIIPAKVTKINNSAVSTSSINIVSGLTASVQNNDSTDVTITFSATASLKNKSGVIPIEMVVDGQTVVKEFSYSLANAGKNGSDSISYSMIMSSYVIAKKSDGSLDTKTIRVIAKSSQGSFAPVNYNARFIIEKSTNDDMTSWEKVYTSSTDENQYDYTLPADIKGMRCSMYLAGGTTNLLDQQIIPVVSDGSDGSDGADGADGKDGKDGTGYTIVLTNESHTFAAGQEYATGGVAETNIIAYKNATKIATNVTKINSTAVSGNSSVSTGITGLTASVVNNNSTTTLIRFTANSTLNVVQGSIPVEITADGKQFTKNFSFSLALTGADGEDGKDGNAVTSVDVWYCLSDSNTTPPEEGWATEPPQWTNGKYIWSKTITTFSDPLKEDQETSPVCISGSKGSNGEDGISFTGITEYYLTTNISESSKLPEVGTTAWKTTIEQITETKRYLWNYEVTEFSNGDKSEPTTPKIIGVYGQKGTDGNDGVSIGGIVTYYHASTKDSGVSRTDPNITWSTNASTQKIDSTKRYLWKYDEVNYTDGSTTYTDAYLAGVYGQKGDNGVNGINTATLYLYKRSSSVPTKPTTESIYTFASKSLTGNDIGSGKWETTIPDGTNPVYVIIATASSNGAMDTIPGSEWSTPTVLAKNGEDGLKGYSTAIVYLYRRSATIPSIDWNSDLTYNFSEKTITSQVPTNWSKIIPAGSNPLYITMATAFSNENTVAIPKSSWSAPVLFVQNGADGADGKNGTNSATVYLYKRSNSVPALPSNNLIYTFSSGSLSESTSGALNGWSTLIPSGTNPIYVTFATANSTGSSDTIGTDEWTDPVIMAQNGKDGTNGSTGYNNAIIQLYKRSKTAVSVDWSNNLTYTFSTNNLSSIPSGWSRSIPSGSDPLYVTAATAYANTATKVIKSTEWSTPVLLAQNGTNGTDGKDGTNGSDGRGISSTSITYQASTSGTTPPSGSWSPSIPTVPAGQYLWTKMTINYTSGSPTNSYSVSKIGEKGDTGATGRGITGTTVTYQASSSGTTAPTGNWTSTIPTVSAGQYLWTKTVTTYTSGDPTTSYSVGRMGTNGTNGKDGANGSDGRGITGTTVTYQAGSSGTQAPTGEWKNTIPTVSAGQYLWTKTVTTYTSGEPTTSYSVGRMGTNGTNGKDGADGSDGRGISSTSITYQVGDNGTTAPSGEWTSSVPEVPEGKYLWTKTTINYTSGNPSISYSVGKMGEKGATGAAGKGISSTVVTYQAGTSGTTEPTGNWLNTIPNVPAGQYLWTKTVINYTTGSPTTSYSVSKIGEKGATGATGAPGSDGRGISSTVVTYQAGSSGTTVPTGSWQSTVPTVSAGQYLWTKTVINYTSGDPTTSYSVGRMGTNGTNGANGINVATVYLYRRSSSTILKGPSTNVTYTFSTGKATGTEISQTGESGLWSTVVPSGTEDLYVVTATAVATQPATTDTISSSEWSTPVIMSKNGTNGVNGYNSAIVYLYKRVAESSAPTSGPTTSCTYTFASKSITGNDIGSGKWETEIPDGTNPLYVVAATAMSRNTTDTIDPDDWSTPVVMVKNGTNGTNGADGYNAVTVYLYTRSTSTPSKPTANVTYTFSTGVASGTDIGSGKTWQTSIPNGSNPIYVITATAISKSDTFAIIPSKWSNPVKLAQNGSNGTNGTSATTVLLSNECYTFSADSEGKGIASSIKCDVYGYLGATAVVTTIGTATNVPTGMKVTVSNSSTTSTLSSFTVSIDSTMTKLNGYIEIPIVCNGITFKKKFTYSLSKEGDPGRVFIVEPSVNIISRKIKKTLEESGLETKTITINPDNVTFNFYQRLGLEETMTAIQCNYTIATSTNGTTFTDKSSSTGTSCSYTITREEYDPQPTSSGAAANPIKAIRCTIKSMTDTDIVLARVVVVVVDEVNNEYINEEFQNVYAEINRWSLEAANVSAAISKDVTNAQYKLENLMSTIDGGNIYEFDEDGNLKFDEDGNPIISDTLLEGISDTFQNSLYELNASITELKSEGDSIQATVRDFTSKLVDTKVSIMDENGNVVEVPAYESFVRTAQQIIDATAWQTKFMEGTIETASMKFDSQHGLTIKTSAASGEVNEDKYETVITGTDFSCYYNQNYEEPVFHISKDEVQTSRLKVNNGIDLTNLKIVNCSQSKGSKTAIGVDFVQSIS